MKLGAQAETALTRLPPNLHSGLRLFFEQGVPPGGFLTACIENDLMNAATRAEPAIAGELPAIMRWLYNYVPASSWGSEELRLAWQSARAADRS